MITIELVVDRLVMKHSASFEAIQLRLNTTDELRNVLKD